MTADMAPERPRFDGCEVVEKVRSGPIHDLFRARQEPLGRPVLIKALSSSILPSSPFAGALEREARLLAELQHQNILHLYDFIRRENTMWLVLEHVGGVSLDQLIEGAFRLRAMAAAAIALQIARALQHAHDRGIVHRDVQPRNVLVATSGVVKLASFAVASDQRLPTAPELLQADDGFGTPSYMSPEQVLGENVDPRSDLFSLGVVLYEMLTGQRPFDAEDRRAATQRIRHGAPPPLHRAAPGVPSSLERIVQRCLQKMASDRFHSASELARALEQILLEHGAPDAETPVVEALAAANLCEEPAPGEATRASAIQRRRRPPPLKPVIVGHAIALGLVVAGGALIHYHASRERAGDAQRGSGNLQLVPAEPAHLRVVAQPWARVIVDGEEVETTPFAHPIPLAAGVHYIRLEHPDAPTERRTVRLAPGEIALLDVKMDIGRPPKPGGEPEVPLELPEVP